MTALGVYGLVAFAVTRRTREIGIRLALGARRRDVWRMLVGDSALPILSGLAIGLGVSLLLRQLLRSLLFEVSARDPLTYSLVVPILLVVTALAVLGPARRATRLDPTEALRTE